MSRHIRDEAVRQAYNDLDEANRYLREGNVRNARNRQMLRQMARDAMDTIERNDRMNRRNADYTSTGIGYRSDDDMDYSDDDNYPVDRRGRARRTRVRGYTRRIGNDMNDYSDYSDDWGDNDDYSDTAENARRRRGPRFRSARTGRFLPDTYRSRGGRVRRADMDDMDYSDDDMYNAGYTHGSMDARTDTRNRNDIYPVAPRQDDYRSDRTSDRNDYSRNTSDRSMRTDDRTR